ncbi:MAG TPA: FliH/SctL family protein [Steroidobacteraceae bacterium]|nr:FliH/SctL family protein [Steroidobacteraceae bacterium]
MIVRGASISSEPRKLEYEAASIPAREPSARNVLPAHVKDVLPAQMESVAATPLASQANSLHERLSFESVAAWLAVQDGETRAACAAVLADEIAQTYENAKHEGFAEGFAEGAKAARTETANALALIKKILAEAEVAFANDSEQLADQCADIVAEAFSKLAGKLLPVREAAVGAVIEVLTRAKDSREVLIRVSPADLAIMEQSREQLAAAVSGRRFNLVADPQVELGGCIVESKLGNLDGRLEVQLRELFETLRAAKSKASEDA